MASCDAGVLISGETGTGKELCALAIHYLSPRSSEPFVPFNCGAIPTDLMENELFGHVQGAFKGAATPQAGLIREADAGTLFLDDVDCLPLLSQVKLLRFLQEKEYRQLGSMKVCQADVRVIAATNADLETAVEKGKLRQDLFYRLNVISVEADNQANAAANLAIGARNEVTVMEQAIETNLNKVIEHRNSIESATGELRTEIDNLKDRVDRLEQ